MQIVGFLMQRLKYLMELKSRQIKPVKIIHCIVNSDNFLSAFFNSSDLLSFLDTRYYIRNHFVISKPKPKATNLDIQKVGRAPEDCSHEPTG